MARTFVIVNPTSGQRRSQLVRQELADLLNAAGLDAYLYETQGPEDATAAAHKACAEGFDRVVVAAGDGTVHEAIGGLVGSDLALGLIPLGTGNVLAKQLGLPLHPKAAVEVLKRDHRWRVDTGRVGERHFVLMAGYGGDAEMVAHVDPELKRRFGQAAFFWTLGWQLLRQRPREMVVSVDDSTFEGPLWFVAISNSAQYAPQAKIVPDARMDDGWLDVALIRGTSRAGLLRLAFQALTGERHVNSAAIEVARGRRIHIACEEPTRYQLDGDVLEAVRPGISWTVMCWRR